MKTPPAAIEQQFTLSKALYDDVIAAQTALAHIRGIRAQPAAADYTERLTALEGAGGFGGRGGRGAAPAGPDTLNSVSASLDTLMQILQGSDTPPTAQLVAAVGNRRAAMAKLMQRWAALRAEIKSKHPEVNLGATAPPPANGRGRRGE